MAADIAAPGRLASACPVLAFTAASRSVDLLVRLRAGLAAVRPGPIEGLEGRRLRAIGTRGRSGARLRGRRGGARRSPCSPAAGSWCATSSAVARGSRACARAPAHLPVAAPAGRPRTPSDSPPFTAASPRRAARFPASRRSGVSALAPAAGRRCSGARSTWSAEPHPVRGGASFNMVTPGYFAGPTGSRWQRGRASPRTTGRARRGWQWWTNVRAPAIWRVSTRWGSG